MMTSKFKIKNQTDVNQRVKLIAKGENQSEISAGENFTHGQEPDGSLTFCLASKAQLLISCAGAGASFVVNGYTSSGDILYGESDWYVNDELIGRYHLGVYEESFSGLAEVGIEVEMLPPSQGWTWQFTSTSDQPLRVRIEAAGGLYAGVVPYGDTSAYPTMTLYDKQGEVIPPNTTNETNGHANFAKLTICLVNDTCEPIGFTIDDGQGVPNQIYSLKAQVNDGEVQHLSFNPIDSGWTWDPVSGPSILKGLMYQIDGINVVDSGGGIAAFRFYRGELFGVEKAQAEPDSVPVTVKLMSPDSGNDIISLLFDTPEVVIHSCGITEWPGF